ncbi:hypothetical protein SUGI_0212490 [Cryptomeria japonica]|nr:hypothetical protein SUGI_0212490 [Cryptomeria japonica]
MEKRSMYLSSNQFVGEIPPTLVKLQNLKELILQGTSLKGPIPSSINNLIKMKYLVLRNNITAKIPDISELTKLEALIFTKWIC